MKTNLIPPPRLFRRLAFRSRGLAAAATLTVGGAVFGGTFSTDFSSDPGGLALQNNPNPILVEDGYLKLVDLQDFVDGLTGLPIQASYIFPEIEPDRVAAFTATFKVRIGGGTERSSQGLSFVLANDYPDEAPFREAGGNTLGLVISFDTIDGRTGASTVTEGNDPGAAPGIIIRQGGKTVTYRRFDGLRTGDNFVPVEVKLEADGTLDVTYNGVKVYDNVAIGYLPLAGRFAFGAGTEEITSANRDNFWVDDFTITTTPVSGAYLSSVLPLVQDAAPDTAVVITIEDLGAGATTLTFDGNPVEAARQTVGSTTTLTYDPPGLLEPGSSHQIVLTYGDQTFSYAFTVISAAVLPATAAVAADTVNLSSDGFSLQVYQVETLPGSTSYAVSEAVLAGQAGENLADLSGATGGIFERTLVNFEQFAGEAGSFNSTEGHPDDYIPGLPGITGTTDNAAVAITGVLELQPGAYTLGSVSDDNMRIAIGEDPRDLTALKLVDINIGTASGSFIVQQAGLYPFRAVWGQGGGGAHFELWSETSQGTRILLNDRPTSGHVKSYSRRTATYRGSPYVSSASPLPGELNVSTRPTLTLGLTDDPGATVVSDSIKVFLNGTEVSSSSTKQGTVTTVTAPVAAPLETLASQLVAIEFSDSNGKALRREYAFSTGRSTGGNLANAVKGYWTFDQGNLRATVGRDLQYIDPALASRYAFGNTTALGLPDIDGQPAQVIHIPYSAEDPREVFSKLGLRLIHGIAPNGGGTKVNQWTLILDVLWGPESQGFGGLLQTHDFNNPTDGDLFWRRSDGSYGKGCCSIYDELPVERSHQSGEWARIVFVADLAANPPRLAKYINGYKHREDLTGDGAAVDGRYGLPPEVFLFGDGDDNERTEAFVNAIQIREGTLTDDEVAALGGPSASGIPLPYAQWDFDQGNLAATVGNDAQFIDPALASRYTFGTTTQFGIPDIDGQPAQVLHIPYSAEDPREVFSKLGLRIHHGLGVNGGGTKLNRWTLILDLLWGPESQGFGGLLQTHDFNDPTDGDLFWRRSDGSYGKGCCSIYDGLPVERSHQSGEWARIVFVADLTANPPRLAKYINGYKHREDLTGDGGAWTGVMVCRPRSCCSATGTTTNAPRRTSTPSSCARRC